MKRYIITITAILVFGSAYSQFGLYLGIRGGAGAILTQNQVSNLPTTEGFDNVFSRSTAWSGHAKGEALIGFLALKAGLPVSLQLFRAIGNHRTGHGIFTWTNGNKYEGQFENGIIEGAGTFYWPNGDMYIGTWVNNQRNGKGKLISKGGIETAEEYSNGNPL